MTGEGGRRPERGAPGADAPAPRGGDAGGGRHARPGAGRRDGARRDDDPGPARSTGRLQAASDAYLEQLGGETGQEDARGVGEPASRRRPTPSSWSWTRPARWSPTPPASRWSGCRTMAAVDAARRAGQRPADGRSRGHVRVRLLTVPIAARTRPRSGWLQTGIVLTLHDRQSQALLLAILVVGAVGLLGAALATLWITGRALVPIRAAFETERRFVADASHEIRTPAAVIRSSAEVLQREDLVAPNGRALVGDIVGEADRLGRLVEDLLALSASEQGALAVEIGADRPRRARSDRGAAGRAARRAIAAFVSADRTRALRAIAMDGDADRLLQVLLILLDNAFRHSPPGGPVEVTVARVADRRARVEVLDQGRAFPSRCATRFSSRSRGCRPRARRADAGSGLGLAIARRLVELHEGTLTVEDGAGGGARFVMEVPVQLKPRRDLARPGRAVCRTTYSEQTDRSVGFRAADAPQEQSRPAMTTTGGRRHRPRRAGRGASRSSTPPSTRSPSAATATRRSTTSRPRRTPRRAASTSISPPRRRSSAS